MVGSGTLPIPLGRASWISSKVECMTTRLADSETECDGAIFSADTKPISLARRGPLELHKWEQHQFSPARSSASASPFALLIQARPESAFHHEMADGIEKAPGECVKGASILRSSREAPITHMGHKEVIAMAMVRR
ncbi:uncharacterized protein N7459_004415 [Penicillium hispanicum]|uniref:uncharacterized protein n=1 Tax=Penicillium hispanicum TaxID=1080232 RepID=UPI0025406AF9|nr:uncharacterized protein N7459_004415 [Penicillium hispanicum]KAJ5584615.1 hypothetical protein N7459_004415 [Penicillium hispanicum]